MAEENGDILGSENSRDDTYYLREIARSMGNMHRRTKNIEDYLANMMLEGGNLNRQNFTSKADEKRQQDKNSSRSSSFSSSSKGYKDTSYNSNGNTPDKLKKLAGGKTVELFDVVFDGIDDALMDQLNIPNMGQNTKKTLENVFGRLSDQFDNTYGMTLQEFGREISRSVSSKKLTELRNGSGLASKFTNLAFDAFDEAFGGIGNAWDMALNSVLPDDLAEFFSTDNLISTLDAEIQDQNDRRHGTGKYAPQEEKNVPFYSPEEDKTSFDRWIEGTGSKETFKRKLSDQDFLSMVDSVKEFGALRAEEFLEPYKDSAQQFKEIFTDNKLTVAAKEKAAGVGNLIGKAKDWVLDTPAGQVASGFATTLVDLKNEISDSNVAKGLSTWGDNVVTSLKGFGSNIQNSLGKTKVAQWVGGLPSLAKFGGALTIGLTAFTLASNAIGKFASELYEAGKAVANVANRWERSAKENIDNQTKRLKSDYETLITQPFDILKESAEEVRSAWKDTISVVNATQGYTKDDLSALMSSYAARLESEGLSSAIGTTDVITMLKSILESGLSGAVAEEFAYQVTVLNSAVPTENWSSYTESYASMVSSLIASGKSQSEALSIANSQLQMFASNILTASREVSGGLTTSLTNVSSLFNDIVKITQTAGGTNTNGVSSALSIVQAVAGKVSSSVGSDLVSQIVSAAVGGNSNELVALRSMAGTGASNTAFLRSFYADPNNVLATLFTNLSAMINNNQDNYMEVAYSLADTFGVTADALVRIDWDELIYQLQHNSSSMSNLNSNLELVTSGETTTSAEAQKLAQINEFMMEEGLSYIIDNDAAWQIQQHMWDQERAEQMMEATYSVELEGAALHLLEALKGFVAGIANVLTLGLFGLTNSIVQVSKTFVEDGNLKADIAALLEVGKVGNGNQKVLNDLLEYDVKKLSEQKNLLEIWGQPSKYYGTNGNSASTVQYAGSIPESKYNWSGGGKSDLALFENYRGSASNARTSTSSLLSAASYSSTVKDTSLTTAELGLMDTWLNNMSSYIEENMTFEDWYNSSGIDNLEDKLDELGYTESDLLNSYTQTASQMAVEEELARKQAEEEFWESGRLFWEETFPTDYELWNETYQATMTQWTADFKGEMLTWKELYTNTVTEWRQHLDQQYDDWKVAYLEQTKISQDLQKALNSEFTSKFVEDFLYEWKDYYIGTFSKYREATNFDNSVSTITKEKNQTGEAVLALAKTLTQSYEASANPQVQTNALLGQIVVLLQAIFNAQTSSSGGLTLPTALSALGLNMTGKTES